MPAQIVIVVLLCFIYFLPGLLNELLSGPHISVALANIHRWLLCEYSRT